MKKLFFAAIAVVTAASAAAQTQACAYPQQTYCVLMYKYDDAGNRIERSLQQACTCIGRAGRSAPSITDNGTAPASSIARGGAAIASISPNPTADGVVVLFSEAVANATVIVSDSNGKQLGIQTVSGSSLDLSLGSYPAGIYSITLRTDASVQTQRVAKIDK